MTLIPKHLTARTVRRSALLVHRFATAAGDGDPQSIWEAKATKEAKGGDPYKAFGSTNYDVRLCRSEANSVTNITHRILKIIFFTSNLVF